MKRQTWHVVFTPVSSSVCGRHHFSQAVISSYPNHGNSLQTISPLLLFHMSNIFFTQHPACLSKCGSGFAIGLLITLQWFPFVLRIEPKSQTRSPSQPATPASLSSSCHTLSHLLPRDPFIYLIPSRPAVPCLAIISWRNPSLKSWSPWNSLQWHFFFIVLSQVCDLFITIIFD